MNPLTPEQRAAVSARGNTLVTAGAGTGKTLTLVERCLRLILEQRESVENLLLVTFTEAAAAEMRERLRQALREAQAQRPDDEHLARQLALLDTARISTLHGFCRQLIGEHFHELGLDPQFNVLDEQQTAPLRRAALDAVLERFYAGNDPEARAVQEMIRVFGRGRDRAIRQLVLRIHDYARSLPDPDAWLEEQQRQFEPSEPTAWRRLWWEAVALWRREWLEELEPRRAEAPAIELCFEALTAWQANPSGNSAERALLAIRAADESQEGWPRGVKTRAREPIKDFFEEAAFLASLLPKPDGSDPIAEDWAWARPHVLALLRLTRAFAEEFAARKRELAGLDFADLEQFALRLLCERGTGRPTAIARAWRERLHHVFVDEYQDINGAQDAILTALGCEGNGNRFLVGDVKQSIYRFRLANPKIFARYQETWRAGQNGRVLSLTGNFRSRKPILRFINGFVGSLMRPAVGGVAYEPLVPGHEADPSDGRDASPCVELHLLPRAGTVDSLEDAEDNAGGESVELSVAEREARLIARLLRELKESGFQIRDKTQNCLRPVEWKDMAVLLRSPSGRAEAFAGEFERAGVPLVAERPGFFATLEVGDLLNLLRLLDNPLQDIPLVAVLRSPLVGLSPDELARIRASSTARRFWTALEELARAEAQPAATENAPGAGEPEGESLQAKVVTFLEQFRRWRELLRHTSLSQCLETVLAETHYEALLRAGERGPERATNVRRLLDLTRQFDPYQRQGLYRFLRFVQAQQDEEMDLDAPPPLSDDAVQLMSIHKAKGLEFPVVVLAGLGTRFNEESLNGPVLLHETLGLCPRIRPSEQEQSYPSLAWWLARREERRELRGEELRLLYVALTRARDRLILVGTASSRGAERAWIEDPPVPLTTRQVVKARRHLAWLLRWLPHALKGSVPNDDELAQRPPFSWRIYDENDPVFQQPRPPTPALQQTRPSTEDLQTIEQLKARLQWRYPFESATRRTAKASVSELRRRALEETDEEARWLFRWRERVLSGALARRVVEAAELSAAERGLAHHRFLERVALEQAGAVAALEAEARRLVREGHLSAAEAAALDLEGLAAFWGSDLGRRIRAERERVRRELAFTARFAPAELDGLLGVAGGDAPRSQEEFVVVQGVADLVVVRPEDLWMVDFKTDAVTPTTLEEAVRRYVPQVKLYARALERIYGRPVRECALHFLALRQTVPIGLP
ncbi:MAG: UvrD-helicase domain-containing protein [Verrucomicrobiae bacterium]|nr:UvrD-helicase domain-containing protein [Verrucomicrobiae bacterium]